MNTTLIHRILFTLILGVFVVASAAAQDAVFLVGSTHKASLALHAGNTCEWNVYKVNEWTDQKDANLADNDKANNDDDFLFVGDDNTSSQIEITWKQPGKYYVIVEEFNGAGGCSTRRPIAIEVVGNTLELEIASTVSSDCYDGNNETFIPIRLRLDASNALPEKNYEVIVNYTVLLGVTEVGSYTKTFTYLEVGDDGEVDLSVEGIVEELDKTKEYTIRIDSATDGFNTPFAIVPGKEEHKRTIFQLPQTGTMVQQ